VYRKYIEVVEVGKSEWRDAFSKQTKTTTKVIFFEATASPKSIR
jgi:hypothetical protein